MDSDYFFYDQTRLHAIPKRFKKSLDDLPDGLKYAHLNPKVITAHTHISCFIFNVLSFQLLLTCDNFFKYFSFQIYMY